jgi:putative ubiquitin-RnfH superfamily antitoxin RatB of RatAB toxin-antitoxin module
MNANKKANQGKEDANLKELKKDIKTNQAKTGVNLREMREEIKSSQAEMRSIINAWMADMKDDRRDNVGESNDGGASGQSGTKSRRKGGRSRAAEES